jgi:CheY-like chemotaxis protein
MPRILVIDDSRFSRSRLTSALTGNGYDVLEAENGQDAWEVIAREEPDLILTDLLMPVLDGIGLLRKLKEASIVIPVIVVTADVQSSSRTMCEELGAVAVVNKPAGPDEIVAEVRQALNGTRAADGVRV